MRHFAFAPVVAVGFLAAAAAHATHLAPPGGAALVIEDGFFASERNDGNDGFNVSITGFFQAESLIADLTLEQNFTARASIDILGNNPFNLFDITAETGVFAPADVIGLAFGAFGPAVTLASPTAPNDFEGTFNFAAINFPLLGLTLTAGELALLPLVNFAIDLDNAATTANSVQGIFLLTSGISDAFIAELGLGAPPAEVFFRGDFSLTPAAVPVPAALPLALSGAALLGGLGLRKRRKATFAA